MPTDRLDRHMRAKYGATLEWNTLGGDTRCYQSDTQRFILEYKAGKWAIYTFHEEIEE